MAETKGEKVKSPKRRVKPVESVREQRAKQVVSDKPRKRPVHKLLRWIAAPFRWVGSWSFWQSKWWKPFRFIGKILNYVLFIGYVRNSARELRLVTWPGWRKSLRLTWAVLVFSVFFGVILAIVDFGLDKVFRKLILNV